MTLVDEPSPGALAEPPVEGLRVSPQEVAWRRAEGEARAVMGAVNAGVARLVAAIVDLLAADGWVGPGIRSPEQWVCWKAGVSRGRAAGLVRVARRAGELPACFGLFRDGRLTEDAMVRIARRVPASRDAELAGLAPSLLISQLDRILAALPDQPDGAERPERAPERMCRVHDRADGWSEGRWCLPADEAALVRLGLLAGRDAEFRDRNDLAPDGEAPADARQVSWADGLVRMASEAADALDPTSRRTGCRGERFHVVLHHDVDPDGSLGPGQIEHGPVVPDPLARYMACDARVQVMTYRMGRLIGINPTERLANRATRRYLARRDQGCRHPLCDQKLWLHAHHIVHWEDGGPTLPHNLLSLCPFHHRALHLGLFSLDGDPEVGTLRFLDTWGRPIEAPDPGPAGSPDGDDPPPRIFDPPLGERLHADAFAWN